MLFRSFSETSRTNKEKVTGHFLDKGQIHGFIDEIEVFVPHPVEVGYSVWYSFHLAHIGRLLICTGKVNLFRGINQ